MDATPRAFENVIDKWTGGSSGRLTTDLSNRDRDVDGDLVTINKNIRKYLIVEPFYSSYLSSQILEIFDKKIIVKNISVPYKFLTNYGSKKDHDLKNGFEFHKIKKKINELIKIK